MSRPAAYCGATRRCGVRSKSGPCVSHSASGSAEPGWHWHANLRSCCSHVERRAGIPVAAFRGIGISVSLVGVARLCLETRGTGWDASEATRLVRAACRATPPMRMAPSRSNFPYPAPITCIEARREGCHSGRSKSVQQTRDLSASFFWTSSRPAELSFGPSLRRQALRLRRTAHAAVGLDRWARPNERHPCLDGISMPTRNARLTKCRNERRRGRAVMASNASCRRLGTNALSWRHR